MSKISDRPEYKSKAPVLKFSPNQFVSVAVKAMSDKNYGAAVIVDPSEHPIGIVTERDLMRRLLAKGLDPTKTPLSDIMTQDLKLAKPEDNVLDWVRQMSNERFRHVPVINDDGKLISLMSQGDFVSYTWPDLFNRVRDQTSRSLNHQYQLPILAFGIAVYTIILIFVFRGS